MKRLIKYCTIKEIFQQWHDFLRLISFPIGLGCSPVFLCNFPIGWKVFYSATLIPAPICLTELTSKSESKCNVLITGYTWSYYMSLTHGLHMTYQLHISIFNFSAISSSSQRLIVATTSSLLYRLSHQLILVFSRKKALCIACEPNKQFASILGS